MRIVACHGLRTLVCLLKRSGGAGNRAHDFSRALLGVV